MSVFNPNMPYWPTLVGLVLLCCCTSAQDVPRLPRKLTGVVDIPNLGKRPAKIVQPVYPPAARQRWIQGTIVLDVVINRTGAVEMLGCDEYEAR
jgi:hypothetical protein